MSEAFEVGEINISSLITDPSNERLFIHFTMSLSEANDAIACKVFLVSRWSLYYKYVYGKFFFSSSCTCEKAKRKKEKLLLSAQDTDGRKKTTSYHSSMYVTWMLMRNSSVRIIMNVKIFDLIIVKEERKLKYHTWHFHTRVVDGMYK